jgi:hypothetical protein
MDESNLASRFEGLIRLLKLNFQPYNMTIRHNTFAELMTYLDALGKAEFIIYHFAFVIGALSL